MVKTNHREYPKGYLTAWSEMANVRRGDHKTLKTRFIINGIAKPIFACAWKDKKVKQIIFTRGTTLQGEPKQRRRTRRIPDVNNPNRYLLNRRTFHIRRPKIIEMMFHGFSAIDVHDHYRQGSLNMEEGWQTKSWWNRMFASIFGMIVTNAYFAYEFEYAPNTTRCKITLN